MNRKGHIGTALMPIIALILVGNALFVMNSFNGDLTKLRAEINVFSSKANAEHENVISTVNEMVSASILVYNTEVTVARTMGLNDKIDFRTVFEGSLKELANGKRETGLNTNVYGKIANGEYSLNYDSVDKKYVLIVSDVFDRSSFGVNEAVYTYSIEIVFNTEKLISSNVAYKTRFINNFYY